MKRILLLFLLFISFESFSQVLNIEPFRTVGDTNKVFGSFDGTFNASKTTKQIMQIGINSYLDYKSKKNKTRKHILILVSNYNWLKAVSDGTTLSYLNDGFEHLRYNYAFLDRLKGEAFIQYQFNRIMNLRNRELVGFGLRYKVNDSKSLRMYIGSSLMNETNHISYSNISININYIKSSNYFTFTSYINDKIKISNTTYFQYNLNNSKYRTYSVVEISFVLHKNISYKMSFNVQYDNDPIFNTPFFTYSTTNKLSFSF